MKSITVCAVFILSAAFGFGQEKYKPKTEVLLSFCSLSISENLRQSNFSSTETYTFKTDAQGKPFDLKPVVRRFTDDEEVGRCLSNWKFTGFAENTRFTVSFTWRHLDGWTTMQLRSKGFIQTLTQSAAETGTP